MDSITDSMHLATVTLRDHALVAPGERVLILTDTQAEPDFASCLLAVGNEAGGEVASLCIPWRSTYPHAFFRWDEPPEHVAQAMRSSDVIINFSRASLCMTEAARSACSGGTRILWMSADFDYSRPVILDEDYRDISELASRTAEMLRTAESVRITTANGTDLRARLVHRVVVIEDGKVVAPGEIDFFPGGAWQTSPEESSVNGVVVFDGTLQGLGAVSSPLRVTYEDGWITSIEGAGAARWTTFLDGFGDREIYRFSHIGGGLAKHAQLIGTDWEDLIMYGSVIVSGGENVHFGGENTGKAHFNGTVLNATVELDQTVIAHAGVYVRPEDIQVGIVS